MAVLPYVGAPAASDRDIVNRLAVNDMINNAPVTATSVQGQINALTTGASPTYAPKTYVDTQDATFQLPSYYQGRDDLNVPLTAKGAPDGAATLDGAGDVLLEQLPVIGAGYILGPYGTTATATGTSEGGDPMKVAEWNIGAPSLACRPAVFMSVFLTSEGGAHPVLEVRIANSTTAPTYAASTLLAMGEGHTLYDDYQAVSVVPVPDTTGSTPSNLPTSYNIYLTAWVYDLNGYDVTLTGGNIAVASAWLVRGAL